VWLSKLPPPWHIEGFLLSLSLIKTHCKAAFVTLQPDMLLCTKTLSQTSVNKWIVCVRCASF
jgi:hypothetical protein